MTNAEAVQQVLEIRGCLTSPEISSMAKRKLGVDITPAQVSGAIRSLEGKNKVASSKNENGARVFWLVKEEF